MSSDRSTNHITKRFWEGACGIILEPKHKLGEGGRPFLDLSLHAGLYARRGKDAPVQRYVQSATRPSGRRVDVEGNSVPPAARRHRLGAFVHAAVAARLSMTVCVLSGSVGPFLYNRLNRTDGRDLPPDVVFRGETILESPLRANFVHRAD